LGCGERVSRSPTIFATTFNHYLERAASYDYATSNALAHAAPAMDKPLAFAVTDEQAFWLLAAIVRGADFDSPSSVEKASSIAKGQINSLLTERHAGFGRKVVQHEFDVLIRDMPVENEAVLVNSMPEPMLLAADRDDDLVNVPSIATNRSPAAASAIGEFPPEFFS
jgi:hypothetical protein